LLDDYLGQRGFRMVPTETLQQFVGETAFEITIQGIPLSY
jgi:hypothetical protein